MGRTIAIAFLQRKQTLTRSLEEPGRPLRRRAFAEFAAVALAVILAALLTLDARNPNWGQALAKSDFRAFYCAGSAALARQDPYLSRTLAVCERERVGMPAGVSFNVEVPDPAPLPGYVIALFVPFALLPFSVAAIVWFAILMAAVLATIELLFKLTSVPRAVIAAMLFGTEIVACIAFGQLAPLATLAIVAAGLQLARGRDGWTGLVACGALLQPQVGLAVVAAVVLWRPRARPLAVAGLALLTGLSLLAIGWDANLEYVRSVLPAQALAQAPLDVQYSLTWLLYFAGYPEGAALGVAALQYAFVAVAAVLLSGRVARALGAPQSFAFFPASAAVLGGSYIHYFQMAAAVPFAVLLTAQSGRLRTVGLSAAALLAVPWQMPMPFSLFGFAALAIACIVSYALQTRPPQVRIGLAVACASCVLFLPAERQWISDRTVRFDTSVAPIVQGRLDPQLASTSLALRIRELPLATEASWRMLAEKIPTWSALLLLLAAGLALASGGAPAAAVGNARTRSPDGQAALIGDIRPQQSSSRSS